MSGSLTGGGGENVPGIPDACVTRNFTHLARDSCCSGCSQVAGRWFGHSVWVKRPHCINMDTRYYSFSTLATLLCLKYVQMAGDRMNQRVNLLPGVLCWLFLYSLYDCVVGIWHWYHSTITRMHIYSILLSYSDRKYELLSADRIMYTLPN